MASRYAAPLLRDINIDQADTSSQRGLIGEIIVRFERRGFKLVAIKLMTASKEHLEKHYADLSEKPFFKGLVSCMSYHTPAKSTQC